MFSASTFLRHAAKKVSPLVTRSVLPFQTSASMTARRSTTILCVRRGDSVVMAGDGQVTQGSVVMKGGVRKVRVLKNNILVGFAGSTADALTLLDRLEQKLDEYSGQLTRACVELAKAWRSDKYLRRLEVRFHIHNPFAPHNKSTNRFKRLLSSSQMLITASNSLVMVMY